MPNNLDSFAALVKSISAAVRDRAVVFSLHPRTVSDLPRGNIELPSNVFVVDPGHIWSLTIWFGIV